LIVRHEERDPSPCRDEQLRHRHVLGHAVANRGVTADGVVAVAPNEDELPVGDRVHGTLRVAHMLGASIADREEREHLRLNDALPEAVHLLIPGDAEQIRAARAQCIHRARQEVGAVPGVGVGEEQ